MILIVGMTPAVESVSRSGVSPTLNPGAVMEMLVSTVVLPAALLVIVSERFGPGDKHWAYTTVGLVIGFWLSVS